MEKQKKRSVAIVGATSDRSKYGNKSLRAHVAQGWDVYPVNSRGGMIEGLTAYRSLNELPIRPDRISMYVPPAVGLQLLPAIARLKPAEFWLNPGAESDDLVEQAKALGLDPIIACSIVDLGVSPRQFADQ